MSGTPNPYEPVDACGMGDVATGKSPASLGRTMATIVSVFVCALSAIVVGEILSLIALFPPQNHWLDFDGEFSGLILIGMPMLAGGCGALAGLVLGLMYRRMVCRLASVVVGSLPAVMFCVQNYSSREGPIAITTVGAIMILATVAGVMFTHFVLVSIDRRRSASSLTSNAQGSLGTGRVVAALGICIALASLFYDVWLWRRLGSSDQPGQEFDLIGAFGIGILAVAVNVCAWAAHPNRKRVAIIAGFASFTGCVAILTLWYLQLIQ